MATPSKLRRVSSGAAGTGAGSTPVAKKAAGLWTVAGLKNGKGSDLKTIESDPLFKSAQALKKDVAVVWAFPADLLVDLANHCGVETLADRATLRRALVGQPNLEIGSKAAVATIKAFWKLIRRLQAPSDSDKQPTEKQLLDIEGSATVSKLESVWEAVKPSMAPPSTGGAASGGHKRGREEASAALASFVESMDVLVSSLKTLASPDSCDEQRRGGAATAWARAHGTLIVLFQGLAEARRKQRDAAGARRQPSTPSSEGAVETAMEGDGGEQAGPAPPMATVEELTDEELV